MLHAQVHKPMDTSSVEKRNTKSGKCYSEKVNSNNGASGSKAKILKQCYTIGRLAYWKRIETNMEKTENIPEKGYRTQKNWIVPVEKKKNKKLFSEQKNRSAIFGWCKTSTQEKQFPLWGC